MIRLACDRPAKIYLSGKTQEGSGHEAAAGAVGRGSADGRIDSLRAKLQDPHQRAGRPDLQLNRGVRLRRPRGRLGRPEGPGDRGRPRARHGREEAGHGEGADNPPRLHDRQGAQGLRAGAQQADDEHGLGLREARRRAGRAFGRVRHGGFRVRHGRQRLGRHRAFNRRTRDERRVR